MPPAKKTTTPRQPQDHKPKTAPTPDVTLDLDALEREGERPEPFTFNHGGETFTLGDPAEIDLTDIVAVTSSGDATIGNVSMLLRLLGNEQYRRLVHAGKMPNWKISALLDRWSNHYGVDDLGKLSD